MLAEIITIGDEILIGQIVDTNSAFIAQQLNDIGVSVYQITSVQDEREHILKALKEAEENADIIIVTGGLGPTKDDITKTTLAEYFNDTLVQSEAVLNNLKELWEKYVKQPLSQLNIDQALVPSKAKVLMNHYGSASGMWFDSSTSGILSLSKGSGQRKNAKVFVSMPGVPFEMKAIMQKHVLPELQERFSLPFIQHKTVVTYGLGESSLAERLETWENHLPDFIKLAYLPNFGKVRLRLTAKGNDKKLVENGMKRQLDLLLPQIKDVFIGFDDETIQTAVAKLLTDRGETLSTAESFTGGKIAQSLTTNAGASQYFKGSVVSYATQAKMDVLKVPEGLIEKHSVVSKEVAEAMVIGVQKLFDTDYAIATTGNAGPTKGDSDVAVGTVCIAIATRAEVFSELMNLGNHREKVINKAVNRALEMLRKEILKK